MDFFFHDGKFLGIEWSAWKIIGWGANVIFSSRFFVQWYATEKKGQVVVPVAFWWLSLTGSMLFLIYSLHQRDSVFIFAYAFTWVPYVRNLIIHRRHLDQHIKCGTCKTLCPPAANFCANCGAQVKKENETASAGK
ncbi:MAG: lipid-A-disaccharide synthase N-terminal domain-containing protein [Verrucomicrobia bacterium]|nr:lipid-A-disaccharide synthase N-terminal domain-containing protein [Verrucomicrobiota bacterium]